MAARPAGLRAPSIRDPITLQWRNLDGDQSVRAGFRPRRRRAVTDTDDDDGKRRRLLRPRSLTIADDHQQIDERPATVRKPVDADRDVRSTTAIQLELRG